MRKTILFTFLLSIFAFGLSFAQSDEFGNTRQKIEDLKIYPSSTPGKMSISTKANQANKAYIYTISGKPISNGSSGLVRIEKGEIDVSMLKQGIYIIRVFEGDSVAVQKLVIR